MIIKLLFALLLSPLVLLGQEKTSPEMEAYLQTIRKDRMTEDAKKTIRTVASLRTGRTTLTFVKDPTSEMYGNSYSSGSRPRAGFDSVKFQETNDVPDKE